MSKLQNITIKTPQKLNNIKLIESTESNCVILADSTVGENIVKLLETEHNKINKMKEQYGVINGKIENILKDPSFNVLSSSSKISKFLSGAKKISTITKDKLEVDTISLNGNNKVFILPHLNTQYVEGTIKQINYKKKRVIIEYETGIGSRAKKVKINELIDRICFIGTSDLESKLETAQPASAPAPVHTPKQQPSVQHTPKLQPSVQHTPKLQPSVQSSVQQPGQFFTSADHVPTSTPTPTPEDYDLLGGYNSKQKGGAKLSESSISTSSLC
jgi:hypothetical protein